MFKQKAKTEEIRRQWQGIEVFPVKPDFEILDRYVIREKFAEVIVASPPSRVVEPIYYCVEAPLTPQEVNALEKVKDILTKELDFPKIGEEEEVKKVVIDTTKRILNKYRRALGLGTLTDELYEKFIYYIERDMMGFGPLNIIMEDYRVEDVSCDGLGIPIYVWHRDYESMPTNVIFTDREALDDFIIHLAHKAGKHISSAFPIVDAMIYGKHRLAATFREEISPRGSTFTIRKFRERPFSVTELLMANVLNSEMAAYFWLLLEHKASIMILGATGSGKTTLLNALTTFIRPRMKIVTCEETAEINIPRENWVRFVTRESYGLGATERGQVTLFDLVRTSLRYRPDYLIVGEVRGEETFVLFQALATGHGGISTVHAESIDSAVKRFMSPPMNIPETHISLLDAMAMIERVQLRGKPQTFGRRVRYIWEIEDAHHYRTIAEWDPVTDSFRVNFTNSLQLENISLQTGLSREELILELWRRKEILEWMKQNKITDNAEVARIILSYYADPEKFLKEAGIIIRKPAIIQVIRTDTSVVEASNKEAAQQDVKPIEDFIVNSILKRTGPIPYWQIFVKAPFSRDLIIRAMRRLKDQKKIDIVGGIVELTE
ncbi:MAG: type II/IV secretion system ATPase subunit [Candidatus Nezhaarchaeales archaeon]